MKRTFDYATTRPDSRHLNWSDYRGSLCSWDEVEEISKIYIELGKHVFEKSYFRQGFYAHSMTKRR
jgi:hypothetical protein